MANNSTTSVHISGIRVEDFHYQSGSISFAEWISLFTLCLAPLFVHLVAGAPQHVYLGGVRPKWHDRIGHYNPTAILWRYFAIFDRRMRALKWDAIDVAAENVAFWTDSGWDSSKEMMVKCREICFQAPTSGVCRLLSTDTLKTIVVALQGVQAMYTILAMQTGKLVGGGWFFALDSIFFPFAIIGLIRLLAAFWLTDDQCFANTSRCLDGGSVLRVSTEIEHGDARHASSPSPITFKSTFTTTFDETVTEPKIFSHAPTSPRGISIRVFLGSIILGLFGWSLQANVGEGNNSLTGFLCPCFFTVFLATSVVIYFTYIVKDSATSGSIIIPCISQLWFKIYTCILMLGMLGMIVIAALETRKSLPMGRYVTELPRPYKACFTSI